MHGNTPNKVLFVDFPRIDNAAGSAKNGLALAIKKNNGHFLF
jgi:hypothetical protein